MSCSVCGSTEELRPYGKGGAPICFKCAFATPEAKAETKRQFGAKLDAVGPVAVIGSESGPQPLGGKRRVRA